LFTPKTEEIARGYFETVFCWCFCIQCSWCCSA